VSVHPQRAVLFLLHRAPYPLDKGEKIRAHDELRFLARRGHRVHLVAFVESDRDAQSASRLEPLCASMHVVRRRLGPSLIKAGWRLVRGGPLSLGYFGSRRLDAAVRDVLERERPDVVLAYSSAMAQYIPDAWWRRTVFDMVDADSEKWRELATATRWPKRAVFALEASRLSDYEGQIVRRAHTTIVSTNREREVLTRAHGESSARRIRVVPNAIDLERYEHERSADASVPSEFGLQPALAFAGAMGYAPNVDAACYFATEILPLVRRRAPALFWIVGRDPARAVVRLAADPAVRVTGSVPNVSVYLDRAAVVVIPLRIARGIQNKLLEAMAMGCAVVCTPQANAAVGARDGVHLMVADSAEAFADATAALLADAGRRASLGRAAREFVVAQFGSEAFDHDINEAIARVEPLCADEESTRKAAD
jgi:sugar transferase (PEP-CTERM/EpsH1 system associated)